MYAYAIKLNCTCQSDHHSMQGLRESWSEIITAISSAASEAVKAYLDYIQIENICIQALLQLRLCLLTPLGKDLQPLNLTSLSSLLKGMEDDDKRHWYHLSALTSSLMPPSSYLAETRLRNCRSPKMAFYGLAASRSAGPSSPTQSCAMATGHYIVI